MHAHFSKMEFEIIPVVPEMVDVGYIGIAADRSGSMQQMAAEVRSGLNMFVEDQKSVGKAHLHVVQFDSDIEDVYAGPLHDAPVFDSTHFIPRGTTALYDSMLHLIERASEYMQKNETTPPILMISTDGMDNSSKTRSSELRKIVQTKKSEGWKFIFIGSQHVLETGELMGLKENECSAYEPTAEGQFQALRTASAEITRARTVERVERTNEPLR